MGKNTTFHMIYRLSLCEMYYRCYSLICYPRVETPYQSLREEIHITLYCISRTIVLQRWIYNIDNWTFIKTAFPVPRFVLGQISKRLKVMAHGQGMGRHSKEEVMSILRGDMAALSDYLGEIGIINLQKYVK